jgi:cell envelope opacity-associated protein A
MSQALHLDFLAGRSRSSRLGYLFLLAGLALAGWQLFDYSQQLQANAELRAELKNTLARVNGADRDVRKPAPLTPGERTAMTQARGLTAQLNYPWASLLTLIETTQHPDVALLALDPKSRNGQLRLTAEAKDALSMMAYVGGLQNNSLLQNALLTTHQMQIQQPGTPLKFQILAQWKGPQEVIPSDSVADVTTTASINEKTAP